jgi:hypothetical protein
VLETPIDDPQISPIVVKNNFVEGPSMGDIRGSVLLDGVLEEDGGQPILGRAETLRSVPEKEIPSADLAELERTMKKMEEKVSRDLSVMHSQLATIQDFMKSMHQSQLIDAEMQMKSMQERQFIDAEISASIDAEMKE